MSENEGHVSADGIKKDIRGAAADKSETGKTAVIPPEFIFPFVLVTTLFSLWGFANDITNPLVKAFKDVFVISNQQSSFVQMAFYGGYATMALPAAIFIRKVSYKAGIIVGLLLYGIGALMCWPAASMASFNLFLIALYVLTFGLAFLETTANPYILSMGPEKTATPLLAYLEAEEAKREAPLNAEQMERVKRKELSIDDETNSLADVSSDYVLTKALTEYKLGNIATFQGKTHSKLQEHDLAVVRTPYVVLGLVVLGILLIFVFCKLPKTGDATGDVQILATFGRLITNFHYIGGVVAQAFYVGAQIMCWTFVIHYATDLLGMTLAEAQGYNVIAMVIFCSSRFVCTYLLKYIRPTGLLTALACGAMACTLGAIFIQGMPGLYCLIAISACMSLMFPTIYGVALEGLGEDAKVASAGLIFAIVGGALMPPWQGSIIDGGSVAGLEAVRVSFFLPFVCFVILALYGVIANKIQPKHRKAA
jgi:FHS family L-fucose permease-like MFS transporter